MKYSTVIEIDLPRDRVAALFEDRDSMPKWQPGLEEFTHLTGEHAAVGSTYRIRYKMGKRDLEMIETIVERDMPNTFAATYETKGVWNIVENKFSDLAGGRTRWDINTEFRCSGFLKIMAWIMPGMFKKQTQKMQSDFKAFAEGEGA